MFIPMPRYPDGRRIIVNTDQIRLIEDRSIVTFRSVSYSISRIYFHSRDDFSTFIDVDIPFEILNNKLGGDSK